jgi:hypothetical protein
MAMFRSQVQARCYELGLSILKIGGIAHVVDRVGMMSWNDKQKLRSLLVEAQSQLAGNHYSIAFSDTYLHKIDNGFAVSKIQYVAPAVAKHAKINALASSQASRVE